MRRRTVTVWSSTLIAPSALSCWRTTAAAVSDPRQILHEKSRLGGLFVALLKRKLKVDVTLMNLVAGVADDLFAHVRANFGVCQA
jgi:hypothetical protein